MKKTFLLLLLSTVFGFAEAQTTKAPSPKDRPTYDQSKSSSALIDSMIRLRAGKQSAIRAEPNSVGLESSPYYSRMPVAKPDRSNTDRMPTAKLGDPNTWYTMLVKKVQVVNPDTVGRKVQIAP